MESYRVSFCDWFISLSIISSRFARVVVRVRIPPFFFFFENFFLNFLNIYF